MAHHSASTSRARRATTSRQPGVSARGRRASAGRKRAGMDQRLLGGYIDGQGHAREVIARGGAAGSTLVVDRQRATSSDARLVAHLASDEPAENAAVVCSRYLEDIAAGASRCRRLTAEDTRTAPFADHRGAQHELHAALGDAHPVDPLGRSYALELVDGDMSIPELRWCRRRLASAVECTPVSTRQAIASLESYEPVRALTVRALSRRARSEKVSTTVLRTELARVQESPIVLNRRLREVVLETIERQELSMSEIAIRCGRVKRDRRGNESGETSWLARRLGLLAEGGTSTPTPWIHTDVLAFIARRGLGVSPREVEL